jgi:LysM repeat protein
MEENYTKVDPITLSSSPTSIITTNEDNKRTGKNFFKKRKKYHQHIVQKEQETLEEIAIIYDVKISDIMKWNPSFKEKNIIQRGQEIQIKKRKRDILKKFLRQFFQKKKQQTTTKNSRKKK